MMHAEITFPESRRGPLLLGSLAQDGLGLFAPASKLGGAQSPYRVADSAAPEVAVLAIRSGPPIAQSVQIASLVRAALMSASRDPIPFEISGRDEHGYARDGHAHAFFLPEDSDGDGRIDRVLIFCRGGLSRQAREALGALKRLWRHHPSREGRGTETWPVSLESVGRASDVESSLLGSSKRWVSVTPLLKSRYDKRRPRDLRETIASYRAQVERECRGRVPPVPLPDVAPVLEDGQFAIRGPSGLLRPSDFERTRGGRGGSQPDFEGAFLRLSFQAPVSGPMSFGKHSHFGLGLFRRGDGDGE